MNSSLPVVSQMGALPGSGLPAAANQVVDGLFQTLYGALAGFDGGEPGSSGQQSAPFHDSSAKKGTTDEPVEKSLLSKIANPPAWPLATAPMLLAAAVPQVIPAQDSVKPQADQAASEQAEPGAKTEPTKPDKPAALPGVHSTGVPDVRVPVQSVARVSWTNVTVMPPPAQSNVLHLPIAASLAEVVGAEVSRAEVSGIPAEPSTGPVPKIAPAISFSSSVTTSAPPSAPGLSQQAPAGSSAAPAPASTASTPAATASASTISTEPAFSAPPLTGDSHVPSPDALTLPNLPEVTPSSAPVATRPARTTAPVRPAAAQNNQPSQARSTEAKPDAKTPIVDYSASSLPAPPDSSPDPVAASAPPAANRPVDNSAPNLPQEPLNAIPANSSPGSIRVPTPGSLTSAAAPKPNVGRQRTTATAASSAPEVALNTPIVVDQNGKAISAGGNEPQGTSAPQKQPALSDPGKIATSVTDSGTVAGLVPVTSPTTAAPVRVYSGVPQASTPAREPRNQAAGAAIQANIQAPAVPILIPTPEAIAPARTSEPDTEDSRGQIHEPAHTVAGVAPNASIAAKPENLAFSLHLTQADPLPARAPDIQPKTAAPQPSALQQPDAKSKQSQPQAGNALDVSSAENAAETTALPRASEVAEVLRRYSGPAPSLHWADALPVHENTLRTAAAPTETGEPTPADPASPAPEIQQHLETPVKALASQEISLQVSGSNQTTASIRVADRAGTVNISVHASDPVLRDSLRSNLGELSSRLNTQGWKTDLSRPAPAASHGETARDSRSEGERSFSQQQQSFNGRQQQQQRRTSPARWRDELEQQVSGQPAGTGGKSE